MHLRPFVQGINGIIPGGISVKDYAIVAKTDKPTAEKILNELIKNGIGTKDGSIFNFSSGDRLKSALFVLEKGANVDEVSEHIDWKDFEGLVEEILKAKGFGTIKNLILKKPRMEIDVVGIKLGVALLIDCKHWRRTSMSSLKTIVDKQIERTKHYVSQTEGRMAVPAIVTLYQDKIDFIKRVPIIPIFRFSSFIDEFYGNLDEIQLIKSN